MEIGACKCDNLIYKKLADLWRHAIPNCILPHWHYYIIRWYNNDLDSCVSLHQFGLLQIQCNSIAILHWLWLIVKMIKTNATNPIQWKSAHSKSQSQISLAHWSSIRTHCIQSQIPLLFSLVCIQYLAMHFIVLQMFCGSFSQKNILSAEKYFETTWKINVELRSRKVFTWFVCWIILFFIFFTPLYL